MKNSFKFIFGALAVIMLICLLFSINPVADAAAEMVGSTRDRVQEIMRNVLFVALGLYLVATGIAALAAAPWLGVVLIIAGLAFLAIAVIPWLKPKQQTGG